MLLWPGCQLTDIKNDIETIEEDKHHSFNDIQECRQYNKKNCYTSQLKHVFRLEENVSRAVCQNSLSP